MNNITLKIAQLLQSRTFWTIVVLLVGNFLNAKYGFVSVNVSGFGSLILTTLAAYFHINPSQDYTLTADSFTPVAVNNISATTVIPTVNSTGTPVV